MSTKKKKVAGFRSVASKPKKKASSRAKSATKSVRAPKAKRKPKAKLEIVRLLTSRNDWMINRSTARGIGIGPIELINKKPPKGALNHLFEALTAGEEKFFYKISTTQPGNVKGDIYIPAKDVVGLTLAGKDYEVGNGTQYNHNR
jgi:hypothetical protein